MIKQRKVIMLQWDTKPFGIIFREYGIIPTQWFNINNDITQGIYMEIHGQKREIHPGDWIIGYGDGTYFNDLNYLSND